VCRALLEQALALPVAALAVLVFDRRYPDNAAHARFTPQIGQQRAHHLLQVDPVGLGPPRTSIDRNARRIDLIIDDALIRQPAMQPVPSSPPRSTTRSAPACRSAQPSCAPHQPRRQRRQIASPDRVAAHLLRAGYHHAELPLRFAQFKSDVHRGILVRGGWSGRSSGCLPVRWVANQSNS